MNDDAISAPLFLKFINTLFIFLFSLHAYLDALSAAAFCIDSVVLCSGIFRRVLVGFGYTSSL